MPDERTVGMPPAAVRRHATNVDLIADRVDQGRDAANQVHIGAEAYGQLCQFLPGLLEPVSNSVLAALRESTTGLEETATKLRAAVALLESADGVSSTAVRSTRSNLNLPL